MRIRARRATTGAAENGGYRSVVSVCMGICTRRRGSNDLLLGVILMVLSLAVLAESTASPTKPANNTLEALFDVSDPSPSHFFAQDPDDGIVEAVAKGVNPDLNPRKPSRKNNLDLFRTEQKVEIGDQEMMVRFRLRVKSKKIFSMELRF